MTGEISYQDITTDGRLRHPVWIGLHATVHPLPQPTPPTRTTESMPR